LDYEFVIIAELICLCYISCISAMYQYHVKLVIIEVIIYSPYLFVYLLSETILKYPTLTFTVYGQILYNK